MSWKFAILQSIGVILLALATGFGYLTVPASSMPIVFIIAVIGILGIACSGANHVVGAKWLAKHVVRVGLLGTVVGLITAFSSAATMDFTDPNASRSAILTVIEGMYTSLYATLFGIGTNLWMKVTLYLTGQDRDG